MRRWSVRWLLAAVVVALAVLLLPVLATGSGTNAAGGQFAFRLDAPVDCHCLDTEPEYVLRKSLNEYRIAGSGSFVPDKQRGSGYQASGTITYVRDRKIGADIDLTLRVYGFATLNRGFQNGISREQLFLQVRVTQSNSSSCSVGATGEIVLEQFGSGTQYGPGTAFLHAKDKVFLNLCGTSESFSNGEWTFPEDDHAVRVVITGASACPASEPQCGAQTNAEPTRLTVTVNGASCTATVGKNCYRPGVGGVPVIAAANSSLTMQATTDHPMPNGWKLEVRRTADPLSTSGNYYLVCSTTTANSCEGSRPGREAGVQDTVYATVSGPTGGPILLAQIEVDWK
jgi:hypothetical protein